MSTVIEHLADLRKIANRYDHEMHGLRQNDPDFQFQATLLCGVHLDELEAANGGNAIGRLRDALRMALDIAQRRLLLPAEVTHIEALLAEPPADPLKSLTELSEELGLHSVQPPAGQQDRGEAPKRELKAGDRLVFDPLPEVKLVGWDAAAQVAARCHLCDGTGDIHGYDGEWLGRCPEGCALADPGNGEAGTLLPLGGVHG